MQVWLLDFTSHIRLLFLQRSTCSGEMTRPVKGPISVPALIQVFEKMPKPSPGIELWAMMTSEGSTKLESFWTSAGGERAEESGAEKSETAPSCSSAFAITVSKQNPVPKLAGQSEPPGQQEVPSETGSGPTERTDRFSPALQSHPEPAEGAKPS